MKIVTLDMETFWTKTHSLSVMNPIDYVTHKDTDIISCALKVNGEPSICVFGEDEVRYALNHIGMDDAYNIAHNNAGFDALITAWRFGITPKMWGCTQAMARAIHAKTLSLSLANLVKHHGIGVKDNSVLLQTQGRRLKDFTADEIRRMKIYNCMDTDQCFELFKVYRPYFTVQELWHLDSKIRMLVEPKFMLDVPVLQDGLAWERANKRASLLKLADHFKSHVLPAGDINAADEDYVIERVRTVLSSAPMFSQLLTDRGVPVPTKPSPTNAEKQIPALAKTDLGMLALLDHDDELVSIAAEARIAAKSVGAEARMQAFLDVAKVTGGKWPVTVNYCGADTTGRSSGWLYNPLNLNRVNPDNPRPSDALRGSLIAPPGHVIVVADASGIEMRFNHFLWNVKYSTDLWRKDASADIYKPTAAAFYGVPVEQIDKAMRQTGKVQQLACGFGCGPGSYVDMARTMAGLRLTLPEAQQQVKSWRDLTPEIANWKDGGWARCDQALEAILNGMEMGVDPRGIFTTCSEGIRLPSGRVIRYPALRREKTMRKVMRNNEETLIDSWQWKYAEGRHTTFIYGAMVDENCMAKGTLVLTDMGWLPIEDVTDFHLVHDGVEFVRHGGKVLKSVQACVEVDGVFMTPDHEVLTDEGWKEASQLPRPYRPDVRSADRLASLTQRRRKVALGVSMPMRPDRDEGGKQGGTGVLEARIPELRVPVIPVNTSKKSHTRDVETPGLRGVPKHGRSVPITDTSGVEQLRRAWHNCVRPVARVVRELLGRYGDGLSTRLGPGTGAERGRVFPGELQVGSSSRQHHEPPQYDPGSGCSGIEQGQRHKQVYPVRQGQGGVARRGTDTEAGCYKPVYDILNAGPRQRFVVLGNGGPFIVHNCVQAGARDLVYDAALEVFKRTGFRPSLEVYDELAYVVPEDKAENLLAVLNEELRRPPKWFPDIVLWSEGDIGKRYSDAK